MRLLFDLRTISHLSACRLVLGTLSMVLPVYSSISAFAADATDADVADYVTSRATATGSDWFVEDKRDIEDRLKELNRKPKSSETSEIKEQIADEKAKLKVLKEIRLPVTKKIAPEKIAAAVEAALIQGDAAIKNKDEIKKNSDEITKNSNQLKTLETQIAKQAEIERVSGDSPESQTAATERQKFEEQAEKIKQQNENLNAEKARLEADKAELSKPIEVEGGLQVKAVVETKDKKKTVKVSLELDPEKMKKLPASITDKLSDDEIKEFFDKKVGENVLEKTFDEKKTDEEIVSAMGKDAVANELKNGAKDALKEAQDNIGSTDDAKQEDPESELGKKQKELNEKLGVGNEDEKRNLKNKLKIAKFLKDYPEARGMEACDVMLKALTWNEMSDEARASCKERDPKRNERKKELADNTTAEERERAEELKRAQDAELNELQQHCEGLARQRAITEQTSAVTKPIDALMDKLVLANSSSDIFAPVCGPRTLQGADAFDQMAFDPSAEAARLARRMVTNPAMTNENGGEKSKVQTEVDALNLIVRRAAYSIEMAGFQMGSAMVNAQSGMVDINLLNLADSKVQRMGAIYNCAIQAKNALESAIAFRQNETENDLLGGGLTGTGVLTPGSVPTTPGRVGNSQNRGVSGQRPATQRRNQNLRTNPGGQRNGAPRPNYLRN
jgi:hypothetical protein